MNIILQGRNEEKLKDRLAELTKAHSNIKAKYVVYDFTKKTSIEDYNNMYKEINDLDISILINNVGLACYQLGDPSDTNKANKECLNVLLTNILPQTQL